MHHVDAPLVESEQAWSRPEGNQWMVDKIVVNCFNWVLDQVKTNRTKYLLCFGSLGAKTKVGPEVFEKLFFIVLWMVGLVLMDHRAGTTERCMNGCPNTLGFASFYGTGHNHTKPAKRKAL